MLSFTDVAAAAERLEGKVEHTPVVTSLSLSAAAGVELHLKAECLQATGSFKLRGATNAVAKLTEHQRDAGVIAFSSGNHGAAIAAAAKAAGTTAVVVMPYDAPMQKVAGAEMAGARIVRYNRYEEDRLEITMSLAAAEGRTLIPPYDDPHVMAGQGTVALELLDDVDGLDAMVVPVGGGGLLAGCATVFHHLRPAARIYGVEPEKGDDHRQSRRTGRRVDIGVPETIADGQQIPTPGALTWPITNRLTNQFVTVTDDEIASTMRILFERANLMVEPSGASALAAVLFKKVPESGGKIGVIVSGGNIGWPRFCELTGL